MDASAAPSAEFACLSRLQPIVLVGSVWGLACVAALMQTQAFPGR